MPNYILQPLRQNERTLLLWEERRRATTKVNEQHSLYTPSLAFSVTDLSYIAFKGRVFTFQQWELFAKIQKYSFFVQISVRNIPFILYNSQKLKFCSKKTTK